jgi:polygalacturonase
MSLDPAANFAKSAVSTGYAAGVTSIVLEATDQNLAQWPDPASGAYNAVWWDATTYADPADDPYREIVRVTAKSGTTLTITRAQESTSDTAKNTAGSTYKLAMVPTAKLVTDLNSAMIDAGSVYGWVTDSPYSATGDGVTDDYTAFNTAVAALTHIVVPSGTYVLDTSLTVGSGITLELLQGATLSPSSGKTLTINGRLIVGNWAWKAGAGTIALTAGRTYASAYPSAGTWQAGDIVWNSAPAAGEWAGWICVTGGTSGTWKGFGGIPAQIESSAIDVSTTGAKTCEIAHGLAYTPTALQCVFSFYRSSGTGEPVIRPPFISAIDGTNVTFWFYVFTAAAATELKTVVHIEPAQI